MATHGELGDAIEWATDALDGRMVNVVFEYDGRVSSHYQITTTQLHNVTGLDAAAVERLHAVRERFDEYDPNAPPVGEDEDTPPGFHVETSGTADDGSSEYYTLQSSHSVERQADIAEAILTEVYQTSLDAAEVERVYRDI